MTLNQIFDNVQYGEEYTKKKALKESIEKCYDKSLDIFYASSRIKEIANTMALEESEEMKINRLISRLVLVESRLETGKPMSDAYRKIQATAIYEDCKSILSEATKTRKMDLKKVESFGKIIGSTKYFVENEVDGKAVLVESSNPYLNKVVSNEKSEIEEII